MELAKRLGVGDLDSPLMLAARRSWRRWCEQEADLAVVGELDDLAEWTRGAPRVAKDDVLARLASLTATEQDAVTALAWLLVPGATMVAVELRDLHPDIDGIVAGQLWIEASKAHELTASSVARAVLRRTRSEVMAELGIGDAAERRDRAWAHTVPADGMVEGSIAPAPEPFADYSVLELLKAAFIDGAPVLGQRA